MRIIRAVKVLAGWTCVLNCFHLVLTDGRQHGLRIFVPNK